MQFKLTAVEPGEHSGQIAVCGFVESPVRVILDTATGSATLKRNRPFEPAVAEAIAESVAAAAHHDGTPRGTVIQVALPNPTPEALRTREVVLPAESVGIEPAPETPVPVTAPVAPVVDTGAPVAEKPAVVTPAPAV